MASYCPILFNTEVIRKAFNPTTMLLKASDSDKPGEEKLKISCKYKREDKVSSKWTKSQIRSGTVTHIDCCVNVKDSLNDKLRSLVLENVVGYNTDNRGEKRVKIKYKRGDILVLRYMWVNGEVRTGTVIYI